MDREELEDSVCECYSVVNDEYDRLLWNHSIVEPAQTFTKRDTNEELSPVS